MRLTAATRRLAFLLVLIGLAGRWAPADASDDASRPNIVFFLSDDQRAGFTGVAGHPVLRTPTMDRLAEEGVRFENAFVTTSICWISRQTIFSGLYDRTSGYTARGHLTAEQAKATYPAVLRRAGYRTGFVGKFGCGVRNRGAMFDYFEPLGRNPYFKKQPDGSKRHITRIAADKAVEFIRRSAKEEAPFCLSVSFNAPHAEDSDKEDHYPWPKTVDGMYESAEIRPPKLSDPSVFKSQPEFLKESLNRRRYFWRWDTEKKYRRNVRAYYRMISGVDHAMGRVLETLDRLGLDENTVVIFSSDNGYYKGSRGFAGKWSHYEESLRVPLIIHDPRTPVSSRGRVATPMALNVDIPSTILDYAGVDPPASYQGRSLRPIAEGRPPDDWRKAFFCEFLVRHNRLPRWEGVRGQRYMYARYVDQDYEFLHDLKRDPEQRKNFAGDPSYSDVLETMRRRCDALRDRYGGPMEPKRSRRRPPTDPEQGMALAEGVHGKAAVFDGEHYVRAKRLPALTPDDALTWSLWVRLKESHPHPGVIVGNRNREKKDTLQFIKFTSHGFQYFNGEGQSRRLGYDVPVDQWTHLAAVKDGTRLRVYLDGRETASADVPFGMPDLPVYLGGDPSAREMMVGRLDDVRIYDRALTAGEIRRLANRESVDKGMIQHHPLDEKR